MKKWYKKIDFFMIILVILLIIVLYCYAQLKILKKDYIDFCGYTIFRVITGSMADTIKPQDIVIVKITKDVNVNDIITYKSDDDFITHRLITIKNNDEYIAKGDANTTEDNPIKKENIVGKVIFIFTNVAIWINVLKSPQVIIAIVISIIAIKLLLFNKKDKKIQINKN